MEEENKVVAEEEQKQEVAEVEEEPKQEQSGCLSENNKFSLITFILACLGLMLCHGWFIGDLRTGGYGSCAWWIVAGIACAVLGIIAFGRSKKLNADRQPFKVFDKFSRIVSIVDIPLGFLTAAAFIARIIYLIIINLPE